jgi:hypothetical protein
MIIFSNLGIRRSSINEIDVITENFYPLGIPFEFVDSVISTVFLEGKETRISEGSGLLGHNVMLLREQFLTFLGTVVQGVFMDCFTLKMKALWSFSTSGTTHSTMQCHPRRHDSSAAPL